MEETKHQLEVVQRTRKHELVLRLRFTTIPELEKQLLLKEDEAVVAKRRGLAGIPVQKLSKRERDKLVIMEKVLQQRVLGPAVSDTIGISRAGLQAPIVSLPM
ncbi:hypothetical protein BJ912DRAFT_924146 [Pholiota molesta]|nr:hypothetical protein BJ912DRAFT_924146 [Pholiota molesta]